MATFRTSTGAKASFDNNNVVRVCCQVERSVFFPEGREIRRANGLCVGNDGAATRTYYVAS